MLTPSVNRYERQEVLRLGMRARRERHDQVLRQLAAPPSLRFGFREG